jgi:hypothetical protein
VPGARNGLRCVGKERALGSGYGESTRSWLFLVKTKGDGRPLLNRTDASIELYRYEIVRRRYPVPF